jgi:hypothetical protein
MKLRLLERKNERKSVLTTDPTDLEKQQQTL